MSPIYSRLSRRLLLPSCTLLAACSSFGQLAVSYNAGGIQQLSYNGVALENTQTSPADAFHIWHLKVTDMQGNVVPGSGWGETNQGKTWDATAHAWTYQYQWGSIRTQYVQNGDNLDLTVTETNRANSGVILAGAAIYPLALHFPALPAGFSNASYPQVQFNTTGPSAMVADFGVGQVAVVVADASKPLYSALWPAGGGSPTYSALVSSTAPDGLAAFQPHNDRPVNPGQTDTFTLSLRFSASGTPLRAIAADAYASWSLTYPAQLLWTDRRVIGTSYLASSPTGGDVSVAGGFPNNPRRYFNDGNSNDFDIRNPLGLSRFQSVVLQRARDIVSNLQRLHAQGTITWDLEGEEYPQATSYVCSPDQIASVAPEMDSVITDNNSPYAGQKLDDAYFKIITSAGFRAGVCVRPQQFIKSANGTAQQAYLSSSAAEAIMLQKIRYAHDRWGATLFYLDSTVDPTGMALDAGIFQRLAAAFPDSLLIPEESTPRHYAYTAPFQTFLFHGDLGTDSNVYNYYPRAFSVNLVNDVNASTLAAAAARLTASVAAGDILMAHADYWDDNNPAILAIYQNAGVVSTPVVTAPVVTTPVVTAPVVTAPVVTVPVVTAPVVTPPVVTSPVLTAPANPTPTWKISIQSPAPGDTLSGSVQVTASIATSLDAAGSYLMVDGQQFGTVRLTSPPYSYPLDANLLATGTHTLQIWGHSTSNETLLSNTVAVMTTASSAPAPDPVVTAPVAPVITTPAPVVTAPASTGPVAITYPGTGQTLTSPISVSANISAGLDAAGSYLLVDGQQYGYQRVGSAPYLYTLNPSLLSEGSHVIQVWAHTTNNETLLSEPLSVSVSR